MTEFQGFHDLFDSSTKVAPQERGVNGTYRDESKLYNLSESNPVKTGTVPTLNSPYHPDELLEEPVAQAAEQIALACDYEEAREETIEEEVEKERPWIIPNATHTETNTVHEPQVVKVPASELASQAVEPIEQHVSDSNDPVNPRTLEAYGRLLSETARRGLTRAAQGEDDISRVRYEDKTGSKQLGESSRFFDSGPPLGVLVERIQEEASASDLYDEEIDVLTDSFEAEAQCVYQILG